MNADDRRRDWYRPAMLVAVALFLLLRLPDVLHRPGGMDEQWFAVPGYTVAFEGIPRIPYLPARRRASLFENADVCLMALPPGLFYAQAPFFRLLPAGYPTARLPLLLGGVGSLFVAAAFARRLGGIAAATLAACLLAVSRPLLFTATLARPDLLCALCGWLTVLTLWRVGPPSLRRCAAAGAVCGLGGLFHPLAVVFAIQGGVWTLLMPGGAGDRVRRAAVFAVAAAGVAAAWVPLIVLYPAEFRSQFFANVLDRAGPGVVARLLNPLPSFAHHARLIWEFAGPLQTLLLAAGLTVGTAVLYAVRHPERHRFVALLWSSCYLVAAVAGVHPTKGYWVYPALMIFALLAWIAERFAAQCIAERFAGQCIAEPWAGQAEAVPNRMRRLRFAAASLLLLAVLLPGGGLRATADYLTHWFDARYHGGRFIAEVLRQSPREGLFICDQAYVFDVYLTGRRTLLAQDPARFYDVSPSDYTALLLTAEGLDERWQEAYAGRLEESFGSRATPQRCFVRVFVPTGRRSAAPEAR